MVVGFAVHLGSRPAPYIMNDDESEARPPIMFRVGEPAPRRMAEGLIPAGGVVEPEFHTLEARLWVRMAMSWNCAGGAAAEWLCGGAGVAVPYCESIGGGT